MKFARMRPASSAKNETGEFERFESFMQRLVAVPHSEIKTRLNAEKKAKNPKRASRASSDKG
jgi:hypothetical protein